MPLLHILWSIFVFFLLVAWIWVLISVIGDLFRNDDLSGWGKALWMIFVIIVPWLGVLVYLIANGDDMANRQMQGAMAQEQAQRAYIQSAAGTSPSMADELHKLSELKSAGVLSDAEFESQKAKLLAS